MMGEPTVFVRLAGCPVGCDGCDTDYRVAEHATAAEIGRRAASVCQAATRWAWVTGGEPTVHDLGDLYASLRKAGLRIALATAGINPVQAGYAVGGADFVSVSPHKIDTSWVQRRGDQLNVVPGLNGLRLSDLEGVDTSGFSYRFVTPFWYGPGERAERTAECLEFVAANPGWRVGVQAHRYWGVA